jgi:hypothetical protein
MKYKILFSISSNSDFMLFKGTMSQNFLLQVFFIIIFPKPLKNNIRVISIFFKNSQRYSQVNVHHWCSTTLVENSPQVTTTRRQIYYRYQRQWQETIGTISDCSHLNVKFEGKFICMLGYGRINSRLYVDSKTKFYVTPGTEVQKFERLSKTNGKYTVKKPKGFALCSRNLTIPVLKCIFRTVEK